MFDIFSGGKTCGTSYRKPDYSYAMLIYKAINDTEEKRMQLFQIYEWIENHYLYYKHTPGTHWKVNIFTDFRKQFSFPWFLEVALSLDGISVILSIAKSSFAKVK